jgi:hypothetical protein
MGKQAKNKFSKRFSGGLRIIYLEKPLSGAGRDLQVAGIRRAVAEILTGLLGREPTEEELLGLKLIKKSDTSAGNYVLLL